MSKNLNPLYYLQEGKKGIPLRVLKKKASKAIDRFHKNPKERDRIMRQFNKHNIVDRGAGKKSHMLDNGSFDPWGKLTSTERKVGLIGRD